MIRARNTLRPDAACHSSDVLTPVESALDRVLRQTEGLGRLQRKMDESDAEFRKRLLARAKDDTKARANRPMKWGDVPAIRAVLQSLLRATR